MIKRLSHDIDTIHSLFTDVLNDFLKNTEKARLPKKEFEGAVEGLWRVQDVYKLGSEYLAKGIIDGKKVRPALSVDDLILVGKEMMKYDGNFGLQYLKLAREKNMEFYEIPELIILEKLFSIFYENKQLEKAVGVIDEVLKINPKYKDFGEKRLKIEMESLSDATAKNAVRHDLKNLNSKLIFFFF